MKTAASLTATPRLPHFPSLSISILVHMKSGHNGHGGNDGGGVGEGNGSGGDHISLRLVRTWRSPRRTTEKNPIWINLNTSRPKSLSCRQTWRTKEQTTTSEKSPLLQVKKEKKNHIGCPKMRGLKGERREGGGGGGVMVNKKTGTLKTPTRNQIQQSRKNKMKKMMDLATTGKTQCNRKACKKKTSYQEKETNCFHTNWKSFFYFQLFFICFRIL